MTAPARQARSLEDLAHRPWPPPSGSWLAAQTRRDAVVLHWRADADALRARLPAALELDLHDGSPWLGLTVFRTEHLRLRGMLPLPGVSSFLEANVQTYVTASGKPGLFPLSLDVGSPVVAEASRRLFHLPAFRARAGAEERRGGIEVSLRRTDGRGRAAELALDYRGVGESAPAARGSLARFALERFCFYAADGDGALHRSELHHAPWRVRRGRAELRADTLFPPGLEPAGEPEVLVAEPQDVLVWAPERV